MKSISFFSLSVCCLLLNIGIEKDVLSSISNKLSSKKANVESHIKYDGFLDLCKEVEAHRADRLISWETFLKYSKDPNTVILDTRSREKFNLSHIKGAVNLPFTEFSSNALAKATGYDTGKRVLIYCNNNFIGDQFAFVSKGVAPVIQAKSNSTGSLDSPSKRDIKKVKKALLDDYKRLVGNGPSLALNLPTYITLYGYGYENVYELADLLHIRDKKLVDHMESNNSDAYYIDGVKVNSISVR